MLVVCVKRITARKSSFSKEHILWKIIIISVLIYELTCKLLARVKLGLKQLLHSLKMVRVEVVVIESLPYYWVITHSKLTSMFVNLYWNGARFALRLQKPTKTTSVSQPLMRSCENAMIRQKMVGKMLCIQTGSQYSIAVRWTIHHVPFQNLRSGSYCRSYFIDCRRPLMQTNAATNCGSKIIRKFF